MLERNAQGEKDWGRTGSLLVVLFALLVLRVVVELLDQNVHEMLEGSAGVLRIEKGATLLHPSRRFGGLGREQHIGRIVAHLVEQIVLVVLMLLLVQSLGDQSRQLLLLIGGAAAVKHTDAVLEPLLVSASRALHEALDDLGVDDLDRVLAGVIVVVVVVVVVLVGSGLLGRLLGRRLELANSR
eukprot:4970427-Prymnesium_polylepis.1